MKTYNVVDPAVLFVAGRRVPESRQMKMREEDARYDVLAGVLVEVNATDPVEIADQSGEAADKRRRSKA